MYKINLLMIKLYVQWLFASNNFIERETVCTCRIQFMPHLTLRKSSNDNCRNTVSKSIGCRDAKSQFSTVLGRSLSSQCICEISRSQHHRTVSNAAASVLYSHFVVQYLIVRPCEGRVLAQLQSGGIHNMQ